MRESVKEIQKPKSAALSRLTQASWLHAKGTSLQKQVYRGRTVLYIVGITRGFLLPSSWPLCLCVALPHPLRVALRKATCDKCLFFFCKIHWRFVCLHLKFALDDEMWIKVTRLLLSLTPQTDVLLTLLILLCSLYWPCVCFFHQYMPHRIRKCFKSRWCSRTHFKVYRFYCLLKLCISFHAHEIFTNTGYVYLVQVIWQAVVYGWLCCVCLKCKGV